MAYATYTDVRLYAPQAPDGELFEGYLAAADRVIDARLRLLFEVPFTSPYPGLIINVSAKLAAAEYLKAKYAAINQEPPEHANTLYEEAMSELAAIVENPNLIDVDLKNPEVEEEDKNEVHVGGKGDGVFNMNDETQWG